MDVGIGTMSVEHPPKLPLSFMSVGKHATSVNFIPSLVSLLVGRL